MTVETLLESRLGSRRAADRAVQEAVEELGLPAAPRSVLAAVVLARAGGDLDLVARALDWGEFEEFCAMVVAASGYWVRKNVRLRKPTRQIDIVAESPTLVLAIDCKHWRRGGGLGSLESAALAQAERTRIFMEKVGPLHGRAYLPVLLTLLDSQARILGGVPVVPLHGLREFLATVSQFDDSLSFFMG